MTSKQVLKDKLDMYERKSLFSRDSGIKRLVGNFMAKARHNLETAGVVFDLSESNAAKEALKISSSYAAYDWAIVAAYYAMYHAALGALAALGFKSDDHEATRVGLLYYYVLEGSLESKYVTALEKARRLEEEYVQKLYKAKRTRQIAQYSVEGEFSKVEAKSLIEDAVSFVNRISELLK
ncbi:HEPN domain-containing protein [Candidatus Woesearchaeota archaeon]|nr:HEPN domain-containing protein [Candidatus Woesearchaeota archaeon]